MSLPYSCSTWWTAAIAIGFHGPSVRHRGDSVCRNAITSRRSRVLNRAPTCRSRLPCPPSAPTFPTCPPNSYDPLHPRACGPRVHAGLRPPAGRTNARGARRARGAAGPRAVRDALPRRRPERRRTRHRLPPFLLVREGGGGLQRGDRGGSDLRHGLLGAGDEPVAPPVDPAILRGRGCRP